jgi:hypothetical protein
MKIEPCHKIVLIVSISMLIWFLIYVYWWNHKRGIEGSVFEKYFLDLAPISQRSFAKYINFTEQSPVKLIIQDRSREREFEKLISDISHDESMWYYQGKPTCVHYNPNLQYKSPKDKKCPIYSRVCSNTIEEQIKNVYIAIQNEGFHPNCPLLYSAYNPRS